jgi:translocator protein
MGPAKGPAVRDEQGGARRQRGTTSLVGLAVFLALAFAAAGAGNLLQGEDVGAVYQELDRPSWAPPSWVFGPVWGVLYVLIGVTGWWVWRQGPGPRMRLALALWAVQLAVNAAWPGVFFGLGELGWALAVIVVLNVLVIATIVAVTRVHRPAALPLLPYLAWILFAAALNAAIWLRT